MRLLFRHAWKLVVAVTIGLMLSGAQPRAVTTLASPSPAPILLIVNDAYAGNKYGRYLGEILRAEGLDSFDVIDLSSLTAGELAQHDLAILAETSLTAAQANMLTTYVSGGGRLIAMRPNTQIKSLFGLGASTGTLNNSYLKIDDAAVLNGSLPSQGLSTATLQIHGLANTYTPLAGAVTLAKLYSNATTSTSYPAVVSASTGQSVAFTYDLASNVILTRQGNPANANVDVDGDGMLRTIDLFQTTGNPSAPWVDRNKIPISQADEQQRLFARLVRQLVGEASPLPQLWYFPDMAKTMLILTGDAHANPQSYYQDEIDSLNAYGGKITFYLSTGGGILADAVLQGWRAQRHEFGIHPYANNPDLGGGYGASEDAFAFYYSSPKSRTVCNHRVAWQGWTDAADIAVAHNIALDTDFYHWGLWLQKADSTWPHGYITGSGQPMKFIRTDGAILPLYRQLTELVDEQLFSLSYPGEQLDSSQAIAVSHQLMDASLADDYAALMTQFHVDYYGYGYPQDWAEGTMAYANAHGIPIWNADQWLSFVETRHDSNYTDVIWNNAAGTLTFNQAAATMGVSLTTILPINYGSRSLQSVSVDGLPQSYNLQTVKGVNVAFVSVPAGNHSFTVMYQGTLTPAPTITPTRTSTPGPSPTATNTGMSTKTPTPLSTPTPSLTSVSTASSTSNRQPWMHVPGQCTPTLQGAVFALSPSGCGGTTTTFDTQQIYSPVAIKDVTSAIAPCPGIVAGAVCYRLWYVGEDASGVSRIGYAVSPDGVAWTRVPGAQAGGSVLGAGPNGNFDSYSASYFTVMKDGATFKMWYSGYGASHGSGLTEGIGYATSTDGLTWTRVPGALAGGAVFRASGTSGAFDRDEAYVPLVIKDQSTTLAPCAGVSTGATCYRMWYEGATTAGGYHFLIGYSTSPDGVTWTRVTGGSAGGEVLSAGPFGTFDDNSIGIPVVVKDGALYRMWYEAKHYASGQFTIGYVVSTDGVHWVRPSPNQPVYQGGDDPGTFTPDDVWSHAVLKDGATYRMWYTVSTKPNAQRFGHATMTPGALFGPGSLTSAQAGNTYTVSFTTTVALPTGGSVLLTLPLNIPFDQVTAGTLSGFDAGATLSADPAAVSDAAAANTTRGALLIRLNTNEPPGPKAVRFSLTTAITATTPLLAQTFDTREVVEYGVVNLFTSIITPTLTPTFTQTPTPSWTPTATTIPNTATPSSTPTFTSSPAITNTPTFTPTPSSTPTQTPTFTFTSSVTPTSRNTPSQTPTSTSTLSPTSTAVATRTSVPHTATPTAAFVPITGNYRLFLPLIFGAGTPGTAGSFALNPDQLTSPLVNR